MSTLSNIKAIIMDLDGVISDTALLHRMSYERLAKEEGVSFNDAIAEKIRGMPRRRAILTLFEGHTLTEEQLQALMNRKNDYYLEALAHLTPAHILSGVKDFLNDADNARYRLAVASASKNCRTVLEKLGFRATTFEVIGDGYSVIDAPDKGDLFVWVAGRLGITQSQAVVFEDSLDAVRAARQHGFFTVYVGTERNHEAHVSIPSFADVHMSNILAQLC